jgi:hypothetical protein
LKKHQVQQYIRSFGIRKPKRLATHVGLEVLVIAVLVLGMLWAWRSASHVALAARQNPETQRALALAGQQVQALQAAGGIAPGEQCFDASGIARSSTDPGAQCSFDSTGKHAGCMTTTFYCYSVHIAAGEANPVSDKETVFVNYSVSVRWTTDAKQRKVTVPYQLRQSNWNYNGENLDSVAQVMLPQSDGPIGGGTRILAINKLEDIPGGPSVAVASAPCTAQACTGTGYKLASTFELVSNIPDKLITSCSWDFGDGSVPQTVSNSATGCLEGQAINHDYRNAWQLQNLPPYPAACVAPTGEALDSQVFLVSVTVHTTQGKDVAAAVPNRTILPGC